MEQTFVGFNEALYNLELKIRRLFKELFRYGVITPWLLFWVFVGGFYLSFQAFLFVSPLNSPFSVSTEVLALTVGGTLALILGLLVVTGSPNQPTNWKVPSIIFAIWMLVPTLFPLVFLVGVFMQNPVLIDLQNSLLRSLIELIAFALGLVYFVMFLKRKGFTQGSVTIVAISLIFIMKALTTNAFYLTKTCPNSVIDERMAWLSNTAEEVKMYRQQTKSAQFYRSPLGQFVCTRTQEDIFR